MTPIIELGATDIVAYSLFTWIIYKLYVGVSTWRGVKTTSLRGPKSTSFLFGLTRVIRESDDPSVLTEDWATEYGSAFLVPGALGSTRVIIMDPKAVTHFYSKETFGYVQTPLARVFIERLVNLFFTFPTRWTAGILSSDAAYCGLRAKAITGLSPAFSNAAIPRLTSVFYDSSYKMKDNWDAILDSGAGDSTVIDVQKCLDSIGIAGFGHDFGTLDGKDPDVVHVFEAMKTSSSPLSYFVFLLGPVVPLLLRLPTRDNRLWPSLRVAMGKIADRLLERMRKEREGLMDEKTEEKSIIGLLIKAESAGTQLQMSHEEIMAQMVGVPVAVQTMVGTNHTNQNVLLLAGYETTSISLTWALIELSRKPETQKKLREELSQFSGSDPTWEQLVSELPYLDAVVHEVLRLHPPVTDTNRVATEDDIIPLSKPVVTTGGETVSSIVIMKGTIVTAPIRAINRSEAFWGPDAKDFNPERWLETSDILANQFQGHRHILTFSDGPRICLGRGFALAEFKAALSVLMRNYTFQLLDGPETKIKKYRSLLPRPKVAGQEGANVPMRVKRAE